MNTVSESYLKKSEKVFFELYRKIFCYLDFASLMRLPFVSRDFYELANAYFKHFLITNSFIDFTEQNQSPNYFLKLFRSFYSREVLTAPLDSQLTSYNQLKFSRHSRFSTKGVKGFDLGTRFTVFHLYNDNIIFLSTQEYLDPKLDVNVINQKNTRKNVAKFFTKSKTLFYMTKTGQVFAVFFEQNKPSYEFAEGVLEYTLTHPVRDSGFSYATAVLIVDIPKKEGDNKASEESKNNNEKEKKQDIKIWNINELTPQTLNDPSLIIKAEGFDTEDLKDFCIGNNAAYFVNKNGLVHEADLTATNNNRYMIFPYTYLKNRNIQRLFCGFNYFLALEQEETNSIENWTTAEIIKWADSKGFEEYTNIIKYENITGKQLINADKRYLIDVVGITREDLLIKFLTEIAQVTKKKLEKPKLFGWGVNSTGQLGVNTGSANVPQPVEVQLPLMEGDNMIVDIACGKQTVILTRNSGIWITEPLAKKPEKEKNNEDSEGSKKKISKTSEEKDKNPSRWINIASLTEKVNDKSYRAVQVSISKDYIAFLGANLGIAKSEESSSSTKFKGADLIMDRIMWDKKMNKEEFSVGYEDRFLGILEIPFSEFSQKTDIPTHRVKYFKRNGEIVWDRVKKVNLL